MLAHHFTAEPLDIEFNSPSERALYPFQKIAPLLGDADFTFANLESPLSDTAEMSGVFKTPTAFVEGLTYGGVDVVSLANNHMLDASRQGLRDTMETLDGAGIKYMGGGKDLDHARQPVILEKEGIRIGILAYTQTENNGTDSYAAPGRPGVMPLDPYLIKQDIEQLKPNVDLVALSFHWGIYHMTGGAEAGQSLHPAAVEFAHEMIDAGADMILGHHPHFPRAIEIYKGKPVLYSLSHLIFSLTQPDWVDNYIARLKMTKEKVTEITLYPVAGEGKELQQPYQLTGKRADSMLNKMVRLSKDFGTEIEIHDGVGTIKLP
nr:CapA family protein [Pseudomaricurvus alkylphenolicus]